MPRPSGERRGRRREATILAAGSIIFIYCFFRFRLMSRPTFIPEEISRRCAVTLQSSTDLRSIAMASTAMDHTETSNTSARPSLKAGRGVGDICILQHFSSSLARWIRIASGRAVAAATRCWCLGKSKHTHRTLAWHGKLCQKKGRISSRANEHICNPDLARARPPQRHTPHPADRPTPRGADAPHAARATILSYGREGPRS